VSEVEVIGVALPTRGASQMAPAADLVGRTLIELGIDEALNQSDGMFPPLLPVGGEPLEHELHEAADEVGVMALRQNEQSRVVGNEGAAAAALLVGPADERIAVPKMKGSRAPRRQSQPMAAVDHRVTQVLAHECGVVQIMVFDDESITPSHVVRIAQKHHLDVIQDVLLGGLEGG